MKPILFSTPMVQAILDGRKTQTRRIIKEQPPIGYVYNCEDNGEYFWHNPISEGYFPSYKKGLKPKYQIGDILYVKETYKFGTLKVIDGVLHVAIDYIAGPAQKTPWIVAQGDAQKILDQSIADEIKSGCINLLTGKPRAADDEEYSMTWDIGKSPYRVRPSIFMPKAYARIFLKVTNVRVERLQDISEEDAIAEGIEKSDKPNGDYLSWKDYFSNGVCSPRGSYRSLWRSINGKDAWGQNPYVFVYEFERVAKPEATV